jgi:Ca2+-binding RTX toxin-like protein
MSSGSKTIQESDNALINGLLNGAAWSGHTITYSFGHGDMNNNGIADFNEGDWKQFYRQILHEVETFTDLDFRHVSSKGNINFKLFEGGGGESGVPGEGTTSVNSSVGINADVAGSAEAVKLGTFSETWIHELGHALGFKHPHDTETGPALPGVTDAASHGTGDINSQIYTVMGYTSPFLGEDNPFTAKHDVGTELNAQPGSFEAIDIAALQYMYGARAYHTGDSIYQFSDDVDFDRGYTTIWDTGGTDAIDYIGQSRAKIDLRAASLDAKTGGGGWVSTSETLTGGYTIAHGVVIENATGASADDILVGNGVANILRGKGGADDISGGAGADTINGGAGRDSLAGGAGADLFVFRDGDSSAETGKADVISDFESADRIDLSAVAWKDHVTLDYIGTEAFHHTEGEVHIVHSGGDTFIQVDTDGNAKADMVIALQDLHDLTAANFIF